MSRLRVVEGVFLTRIDADQNGSSTLNHELFQSTFICADPRQKSCQEHQFQLNTTFPDLPDSIRSKPFWNSSAGSWWLSTLPSGKPDSTSWVILYQVSYMRRP